MHLYPIKLYLRSLPNTIFISGSLVLNLFLWGWLFWYISPQVEPFFLHYNILFGVDYIGPWWRIYFVPSTGLLIILINVIFGWLLFQKDHFFAHILNLISLLSQVFLLIVGYLLVYLNV